MISSCGARAPQQQTASCWRTTDLQNRQLLRQCVATLSDRQRRTECSSIEKELPPAGEHANEGPVEHDSNPSVEISPSSWGYLCVTREQRPFQLDRRDGVHCVRPPNLIGGGFAQPHILDLALLHQLCHRRNCVL